MANNGRVNVSLTAQDLISPKLAGIKSKLDALGATASIKLSTKDILGSDFTGIQKGLASLRGVTQEAKTANPALGIMGNLLGNLGSTAILGGISLVTDGFSKLTNSIASAAKEQTRFIASSSDIATNLKIPLGDAKKLNEGLQANIANIAASLPGTTSDYSTLR